MRSESARRPRNRAPLVLIFVMFNAPLITVILTMLPLTLVMFNAPLITAILTMLPLIFFSPATCAPATAAVRTPVSAAEGSMD